MRLAERNIFYCSVKFRYEVWLLQIVTGKVKTAEANDRIMTKAAETLENMNNI
jgi:hypothetical protein